MGLTGVIRQIVLGMVMWCHHQNMKMYGSAFFVGPFGPKMAGLGLTGAIRQIALGMVMSCHHQNMKMYSSAFFGRTFGPKMTSFGIKKRQIHRSSLNMARIILDQKTAPP